VKPSHAANDNLKNELIGRTRDVWLPRLGRDLSREDARQIAENVIGFFSVLAEWSRAEMPSPANDTGKPVETDAPAPSLAANSKITDFVSASRSREMSPPAGSLPLS
jgi:hypothetical protein